jgi:hypothetical protein
MPSVICLERIERILDSPGPIDQHEHTAASRVLAGRRMWPPLRASLESEEWRNVPPENRIMPVEPVA